MNAKASTLLAAFADLSHGAVIVEIGCVRFQNEIPSDGWSTVHLAGAAATSGWTMHTVDASLDATRIAAELTDGLPVSVHWADGEQWLTAFPTLIDGLYLDGALEPAQALAQYEAAARVGRPKVVAVDDVQPTTRSRDERFEHGKGDLLLDRLALDGYMVDIYDTEPAIGWRSLDDDRPRRVTPRGPHGLYCVRSEVRRLHELHGRPPHGNLAGRRSQSRHRRRRRACCTRRSGVCSAENRPRTRNSST